MSVSLINGQIDDDVQKMLKVTNLDLLKEVVAEVRYKVRSGMPMLSNQRRKYILAIKAIDKQIPKKLICIEIEKCCPVCKEGVCFIGDDGNYGNYCSNCGQALDWSDKE